MKRGFSCIVCLAAIFVTSALGQMHPDSNQIAAYYELKAQFPRGIDVEWGSQTGSPEIVRMAVPEAYDQNPVSSANVFLQKLAPVLKMRLGEDQLIFSRMTQHQGVCYVRFEQDFKGIKVKGGGCVVSVLQGGLIQTVLANFWKDIDVPVETKITSSQAVAAALKSIPPNVSLQGKARSPEVVIYRKDSRYFLAWELHVPRTRGVGEWRFFVDAATGNVLRSSSDQIDVDGLPPDCVPMCMLGSR